MTLDEAVAKAEQFFNEKYVTAYEYPDKWIFETDEKRVSRTSTIPACMKSTGNVFSYFPPDYPGDRGIKPKKISIS